MTQVQISCPVVWRERVTRVAKNRKMTISQLVRDLVEDGLDEVEHIAAMAAEPVFMEVMKSLFTNAETIGAMMHVMGKKQVSPAQMELFESGMAAFQKVIQGKGKKR